jgi:hypothetical protein
MQTVSFHQRRVQVASANPENLASVCALYGESELSDSRI